MRQEIGSQMEGTPQSVDELQKIMKCSVGDSINSSSLCATNFTINYYLNSQIV